MPSFRRGAGTLYVTGEIDLASGDVLRSELTEMSKSGPFVLDMSEVEFIDSTGLRELLLASEHLNGTGPLRIVASKFVTRVLEVSGLDHHPGFEVEAHEATEGRG